MKNFISISPFLAKIVILIFLQHHLVASLSPIQQKVALFQFKQSLNITAPTYFFDLPSYPKTMNWSMSSDHCTWEGVSCEHGTGHVIGLDLSCSRLEGAILPNSTLFQLSHLRFLNLSNNDFYLSNEFPQEFGFFAKGLTHLNLSNTWFSGRVPSGISHLYKLVSLDLSDEYGLVKLENEAFKSILQNLTQLRVLNLERVDISSVLPVNLSTSLRVLSLSRTGLYGVLPQEIFHLPNLEVLNLHSANISSVVPKNLSSSLRFLDLRDTGIHGVLPQEVFHLPNLKVLGLGGSSYGEKTGLQAVLPKGKWGSSGTLQHLFLSQIDIYGGIPDSIGFLDSMATLYLEYCNLSGPIPKSLGNLGQLTHLGLQFNSLNGPIPTLLENLPSLRYLLLSQNNFTGPLPYSFVAHSSEVIEIDLSDNGFTGPLPPGLFNHTSLQRLRLRNNGLTGPLPPGLFNHTSLEVLDLNHNWLTGPLPPWLFNHPSLEELQLSDNMFTGQLYEFDCSKSQLRSFYCGNNLLYGHIPHSFSQLLNLTDLDFSSNNFSGVLDIKVFSHLESLERLYLSHNSLLSVRSTNSATLPPKLSYFPNLSYLGLSSCNMKEFPHFSRDAGISLGWVDLSNNEIEGEIPHWIGFVGDYLNISHNRLTGGLEQLPWNNIQYLDLQSNKLNGSLPALICSSISLVLLNLSNNTLSGVLPICRTNLTNLSVFDLRMNDFRGNIPATLSNFRNLETLNLHGNRLEGRIPSSFSEFYSLQVLDLGNNQIKDTFPKCLESLPNLQVLILKSNKLHGLVNESSKIEHPFPRLRIIDMSNNEFSGPLPATYFQNFKAIMIGDVNERSATYIRHARDANLSTIASYNDSTTLVIKGVEIELVRILTVLTTIDVSRNNFEGKIPEIMGKLVLLIYLNLSHNYLTGHIPTSIGKLSMLESLDLSFNQLEGKIPQQLTSINTLERLNLSCNQLDGQIPKGSQFNTFENDSYVGNLGLCGFPLSKECEHDVEMQKEGEDDVYFFSGFTWEAVVIGYGCGVVPAFIIGNLMLLARKPKWFAGIISRELGLKIRRMEIRMQ